MPGFWAKLCCIKSRSSYGICEAASSKPDDLGRKYSKRENQGKNRPKSWSVPQVECQHVKLRGKCGRKGEDMAKWRSLPYFHDNEGLELGPSSMIFSTGSNPTKNIQILVKGSGRNMRCTRISQPENGVSDCCRVTIETSRTKDRGTPKANKSKGSKKESPTPRLSSPQSSKEETTVEICAKFKSVVAAEPEKDEAPSDADGHMERVRAVLMKLNAKVLEQENEEEEKEKKEKKDEEKEMDEEEKEIDEEEKEENEKDEEEKNEEENKDERKESNPDSESKDRNKQQKAGDNQEEESIYQPMRLPASARKIYFVPQSKPQ